MPKAYWVVTYRSVKNPKAWKAYAKLAVPAIEGSGGRFLARSNPAKIYEAGMNERVVLVEFPSLEKALACHDTSVQRGAQGARHRQRRARYDGSSKAQLSRYHSANG
jgi:uncharacterized protein (DUF1330 family)